MARNSEQIHTTAHGQKSQVTCTPDPLPCLFSGEPTSQSIGGGATQQFSPSGLCPGSQGVMVTP